MKLDLDEEYRSDKGKNLIKQLEYSAEDEENNRPAPTGIMIKGSKKKGLESLRSAINNYMRFCQNE
ncbi:MAG: hypothetical protein WCR04_03575 [Fibrobacteraceae bacterium]